MADNTEVLLLKVQAIVEGQASLVALASELKGLESSQVAAAKAQAAATEQLSRQLADFAAHQSQVATQTQQLSAARLSAAERLVGISNQQTELLHREAAATAQLNQQVAALPAKQIAVATTTAAAGTAFLAVDKLAEHFAQTLELVYQTAEGVVEQGFETARYRAQFSVLEGSADAAEARLTGLEQFALTYNLDFPQVIEAARQLDAVGLKDERTLLAIASTAAVTGRNLRDVAQAMVSVSRGDLGQILQLVPAPSSELLQAQRSIEASAKKTPEALRYYTQQAVTELLRQYGGGLDTAANLTESKLTGIRNRFAQFRQEIFDAGVGDAVNRVVDQILNELEILARDGTLEEWARGVGDAARFGAEGLSLIVRVAPAVVRALQFTATAASVAAAVAAIAGLIALGPELAAFLALVRTSGVVGALDAATVGMGGMRTATLALVSPLGIAAAGVAGVTVAVNLLADAIAQPFTLHLAFDASREQIIAELHRLEEERDKLAGTRSFIAAALTGGNPFAATAALYGTASTPADLFTKRAEAQDQASKEDAIRRLNARIGAPVPPLKANAPPPAKPDADADRAFQEALKQARELLSETEKVSKEATEIVTSEIRKRLDASGAEGEERIRLLTQYAAQEQAVLVNSGALRDQLETELAQNTATRRAEIAASGASAAVQKRLNAELSAEADASQRAIEIAFSTGRAEAAVRKGVAEQSAKERREIEEGLSRDRAKQQLEDARFERDLFGLTAAQYAQSLRSRLDGLKQYSAEAQAIAAELAKAQQAADQVTLDQIRRAAAARRPGESVGDAGQRLEGADRARENAGKLHDADQDNLEADYAARVDYYAKLLGVHNDTFEQMTLFERQQYQLALQAASSFYGALRTGAAGSYKFVSDAVKKTLTDEQSRFALVGFLTQRGSKEAIAAAAEQAQQELKVRALVWTAEAIAAAATGQFQKAAGLAEAAALAGVGVAVTGAIARSERASIAEDQRQNAVGSEPGAATTTRASDTRLTVSQGNQPITMNFYNSVSFEGGTVFLDRAGARLIVDQLADAINEGIQSGKIHV